MGTFVRTGVRETFATRRCDLTGLAAGRLYTASSRIAIAGLLTSTPYSSRWVSTFILCHVFDVEVSQVQNCREVDLVNVLQL